MRRATPSAIVRATSDELYNFGFAMSGDLPNTPDVGLVILDQAITLQSTASSRRPGPPTARDTKGPAGTHLHRQRVRATESNPVKVTSFRERLMAQSKLTNLRSAFTGGFNLQTNGNGNGRGGTCSGDTGGAVFYGEYESNMIVGVTSFGLNYWCRGVDFAYRTDTTEVLDWIESIIGSTEFERIDLVTIDLPAPTACLVSKPRLNIPKALRSSPVDGRGQFGDETDTGGLITPLPRKF